MRWGKKTVGRPLRTRGRGVVKVESDSKGREWLVCSGCGLNKFSPGVTPNQAAVRQHAQTCTC